MLFPLRGNSPKLGGIDTTGRKKKNVQGYIDPRAARSKTLSGPAAQHVPTRHKKNSAQFRPFSMKPVQSCAKFRDAAHEDDPVVITRQISIVFDEILIFRRK